MFPPEPISSDKPEKVPVSISRSFEPSAALMLLLFLACVSIVFSSLVLRLSTFISLLADNSIWFASSLVISISSASLALTAAIENRKIAIIKRIIVFLHSIFPILLNKHIVKKVLYITNNIKKYCILNKTSNNMIKSIFINIYIIN